MTELLYGRNAVRECLRARRRHIHKLQVAQGIKPNAFVKSVIDLAQRAGVPLQEVPRQALDNIHPGHQGMVLEVGRLPVSDIDQILANAEKRGEAPFILALDHLEDPHNLGALLRTAEAVGVHGAILPTRRSAGITPTVVKAAAGATEHIPIVPVSNLVQTLKVLKKANIWIIGIEKDPAAQPYHKVDLNMPVALVLGGEGEGLSRLVKQTCDLILTLPMRGKIDSLNVSVAGGLALYEAWRARQFSSGRLDK